MQGKQRSPGDIPQPSLEGQGQEGPPGDTSRCRFCMATAEAGHNVSCLTLRRGAMPPPEDEGVTPSSSSASGMANRLSDEVENMVNQMALRSMESHPRCRVCGSLRHTPDACPHRAYLYGRSLPSPEGRPTYIRWDGEYRCAICGAVQGTGHALECPSRGGVEPPLCVHCRERRHPERLCPIWCLRLLASTSAGGPENCAHCGSIAHLPVRCPFVLP